MWFIGVEVEQETSPPPPKKNPGSAPASGRPFSIPNWLLPATLTLLLWPLPSIHHFHIAHKMPFLPTKFCKRNWTQSLRKFLGVNKLYYEQMGKWWTFPTVPLPPPPHLNSTNLCLSDFREQNVWNMAILSYTVFMFLLSIYLKILNNNQYLKPLMSASTKCVAWDQAPQSGKRQKKYAKQAER